METKSYTLMLLSQDAAKSKQVTIPAWAIKASVVLGPLLLLVAIILFLDYRYIVNQVFESRELQSENRRLRQQVQLYKNRMESVESSLDRIENFSTRLRMITNLVDRDQVSQVLELPLPNANTNIDPNTASIYASLDEKGKSEVATFDQKHETVVNQALVLEQNLHDLYELLSDQKSFLLALPTKKPADGYFTSGFGVRASPVSDGGDKMHEGLDIANAIGTPIRAPAQGTVTFAGRKSGYGQIVILDHGYGLETWYGHTSKLLVKAGQLVRRGQTIALIGNSGRSTGAHLHYEVRAHGFPVDPLTYILEN